MSWWQYVERIAPGAPQAEIAKAAGVTPPTVSRWSTGKQGIDPAAAASFARAHHRPVLEAFVAAEFLTDKEAKARPTVAPTLDSLSDDDLIAEIRRRLSERDDGDGNTAPNKRAGVSPASEARKPRAGRGPARDVTASRSGSRPRLAAAPDDL